ncbi:DotA/TraY family protein [Pseudomonas sp.]|uniref:DotA/TraY family protein n=1 Tax=Pseudomonas sp. TaxID=306 RepID=UPI003D10AEAA
MYRILLFLSIFLGFVADASAKNIFEPLPDSKAIWLLSSLFGGLLTDGGADPLLSVFKVFNGAMLCVGGVLFAYTILAGTVGTAHDGEMLSKKFSSVWVPIRYSLGTAMLLPVVGGGYCVAQAVVMWIAVQGVGLADMSWKTAVDHAPEVVAAAPSRPPASDLAYKTYESLMCMQMLAMAKTEPWAETLGMDQATLAQSETKGTFGTTYEFGVTNGINGLSKNQCGTVTVKNWSIPTSASSSGPGNSILELKLATDRMEVINANNKKALNAFFVKMSTLTAKDLTAIYEGKPLVGLPQVKALSNEYEEEIRKGVAELILESKKNSDFKKAASRDGFVLAGAFFNKFLSFNDLVQRSLADVPEATGPNLVKIGLLSDRWSLVLSKVQEAYQSYADARVVTFGIGQMSGGSEKTWWESVKETVMAAFDPRILAKKVFTSTAGFVLQDGENVVSASQRMGNWIMGAASFVFGGLILANVSIGAHPGISATITAMIYLFIGPMLLVGALLSYVIPNIPGFIFFMAVLGWLVAVISAIVAAPLWAVVHLTPEGHDVVGSGKAGYMLILSLLLRPVLMVFGMLSGIIITSTMGTFLNYIFADMFAVSQSDSGIFLMIIGQYIVAPILYMCFALIIIRKSFSLIYDLPDTLLKWIGGGESFGHFASEAGSERNFAAVGMSMNTAGAAVADKKRGAPGLNSQGGANGRGDSRSLHRSISGLARMAGAEAAGGSSSEQSDSQSQAPTSFSQAQAKAQEEKTANQLQEAVGTVSSFGANEQDFLDRIESTKQKHPELSVGDAINRTLHTAVSQKFGSGVGSATMKMGGGYSGESYKNAVGMFQAKYEDLEMKGLSTSQIRGSFTDVVANAKSEYKIHSAEAKENGVAPSKNFGEFIKEGLANIRVRGEDDDDISRHI